MLKYITWIELIIATRHDLTTNSVDWRKAADSVALVCSRVYFFLEAALWKNERASFKRDRSKPQPIHKVIDDPMQMLRYEGHVLFSSLQLVRPEWRLDDTCLCVSSNRFQLINWDDVIN